MPLPPARARRERKRARRITCEGFDREDGLWDIEARLTPILGGRPAAAALSTTQGDQ